MNKIKAIVPLIGTVTESMTGWVRDMLAVIAKDPMIDHVVLYVDSPGGSVSGVSELAAAVREVAAAKRVTSFIRHKGASAGYWVASQATEIVAEPTALVGSLGVMATMVDSSKAAEQAGIRVVVVSNEGAQVKGAGTPGTPITEAQIEDQQRIVDSFASMFKADVLAGRKLTAKAVDGLFDGRVHLAKDAVALGLVDRLGTLEGILAEDIKEKAMDDEHKDDSEKEKEDEKESKAKSKAQDDEEMDEDEDEEEEKEEEAMSLIEDIKAIAKSVKEAGCVLSLSSIEAKLTAATKGIEDEIEAVEAAMAASERLTKFRKVVGEHAHVESPAAEKSKLPTDYKEIKAMWAEKYEANRKLGLTPDKALVKTRDENKELHAAFISTATEKWSNQMR